MLLKELTSILEEGLVEPGSKKHMSDLVRQYNKLHTREHASYMKRGRGGSKDWYKARYQFDKDIKVINAEFKKTFRKMIPKSDYAEFSLGSYDTDDIKKFVDEWFKNPPSQIK